jgi:hypothetical protein
MVWFGEITRNSQQQAVLVGKAKTKIVAASLNVLQFENLNALLGVSALKEGAEYRFSVGACSEADCSKPIPPIRWATVDFFIKPTAPDAPVIVSPTGKSTQNSEVKFEYRSNPLTHAKTTHFEIWAGIMRAGKLVYRMTSRVGSSDVWQPETNRFVGQPAHVFSYLANAALYGVAFGDQIVFEVRACADNQSRLTFPRACSKWIKNVLTYQAVPMLEVSARSMAPTIGVVKLIVTDDVTQTQQVCQSSSQNALCRLPCRQGSSAEAIAWPTPSNRYFYFWKRLPSGINELYPSQNYGPSRIAIPCGESAEASFSSPLVVAGSSPATP